MKKIILTLTVWMTSVVFIYAEDITIQEETFWQEIGTRSLTIYPITDDEVTLLFEETQQNVSICFCIFRGCLYYFFARNAAKGILCVFAERKWRTG